VHIHRKGCGLDFCRYTNYAVTMPNAPKTPLRPIRIPEEDWTDFAEAAVSQDTDRSALVREFIAWYLRRPGAKMPKRPDA
jgi:hypothetical protein